jgi:SAM-dependent methyltransferase
MARSSKSALPSPWNRSPVRGGSVCGLELKGDPRSTAMTPTIAVATIIPPRRANRLVLSGFTSCQPVRREHTIHAIVAANAADRPPRSATTLARMRQTRRHPKLTQFDYLHLRRLVDDLSRTLDEISATSPVQDMVDVFCGTRPYDDLFPRDARCIGYDIDQHYGSADVVSQDFLPFEDEAFDLLTCIEGFHYVPNPDHGVSEFRRVLKPGGTALVTVPLVWEYDRTILERRYTGPELANLFRDWEEVQVVENGGRSISWATLTGRLISLAESALPAAARLLAHPLFALAYAGVNVTGAWLQSVESRRLGNSPLTLPMNLLVTARKPPD